MLQRRSQHALAGSLIAFVLLPSCGSEFAAGGSGGSAGASTGGSSGSGGQATGGVSTTGGTGSGGRGGSSAAGSGSGGAPSDGGTCGAASPLTLQNAGFESGTAAPGWAGAGNYPQYALVTTSAARSGSYGAELNDTGVGLPGIGQQILVTTALVGKTVKVTAWVRLVSFPSIRLLLTADSATGSHMALDFTDTNPSDLNWQQLGATITIPASADHLMIEVGSAVTDGNGIAYADDVTLCVDNLCSPCGP